MFEADVAPPETDAPRGAEDDGSARFPIESAFAQGGVNRFRLDSFAGRLRKEAAARGQFISPSQMAKRPVQAWKLVTLVERIPFA